MFLLTTSLSAPSRVAGSWRILSTYMLSDNMNQSQTKIQLQAHLSLCYLDQPQNSRISELKLAHALTFNPSIITAISIIFFSVKKMKSRCSYIVSKLYCSYFSPTSCVFSLPAELAISSMYIKWQARCCRKQVQKKKASALSPPISVKINSVALKRIFWALERHPH